MSLQSSTEPFLSPPMGAERGLNKLIILGAGGYAQEVLWLVDDINAIAPRWDFLGFVDPMTQKKKGESHYDRPVLGSWNEVPNESGIYFACGIGSPAGRASESNEAERRGYRPATLVHPSVVTARHVQIGEGSIVGAGCVLAPYAAVGRHCALNIGAIVGHNACVGDFCVLSPRSQLLGSARLDDQVFLGACATVYLGRKVGFGSVIGANSFVLRNIGTHSSVIGVPAITFSTTKNHPRPPSGKAEHIPGGL